MLRYWTWLCILWAAAVILLSGYGGQSLRAQPAGYKKEIRKQKKEEKKAKKAVNKGQRPARKIKRYKKKLDLMDKDKKDAEAGGNQVKIDAINRKMRILKGKIGYETEKIEKKLRRQHEKKQTKAVQKQMKRNRRKAKMANENKRVFFLKRWFSKQGGKT